MFHFKNKFEVDDISETAKENIIENLKIELSSPSNYVSDTSVDSFPAQFTVGFKKFNTDFNIKFKQITKIDQYYPIKSSDVYVIDKKSGQPVKSSANKYDENYSLYSEVGDTGYAVLVRNSNKSYNSFRLVFPFKHCFRNLYFENLLYNVFS